MLDEDEPIIYVAQARCAVAIKQSSSVVTGMSMKKIVMTIHRCLFFDSLSNQIPQIQYEIMRKRKNLLQQKKLKQKKIQKRTSVTQYPEFYFNINQRQCKIVIEEEKTIHEYLKKIGLMNLIKSVIGIVILKNMQKYKFELISFNSLHDGFKFCKAMQCAKAWLSYEQYCISSNVSLNPMWVRILSQIIGKEQAVVLIDPQMFLTGSPQQIKSFIFLVTLIPFAHSYQHRYLITNPQSADIASQFIQNFQQKTHSLILHHNSLTSQYFSMIFSSGLKLQHLIHLNISNNKLTDQSFITLQKISKQGGRLCYLNLSYNNIDFNNVSLFTNFLKTTQIKLTINLSFNDIGDWCVEHLQRCIIMAQNPPIDQINLSYNKFSRKKVWRLFYGNYKFNTYHPQMNFIIYPIPINRDTFSTGQLTINYPQPQPLKNFNLHSALVQQFQQQSFMKHTLNQLQDNKTQQTLKLKRQITSKHKLPNTKQQVLQTLQLANKIQNFITGPQFVQNMWELANQIVNFQFNLSPVSKNHYIKFLCEKLNQALVVRDHYAVKYILQALRTLEVSYQGYQPRLDKVALRSQIFSKKIANIFNFQIDEYNINKQLDQMVREGLRLYLSGNGVQTLYYLKYMRDKFVERLIQTKQNPQHQIYQKMNQKNMKYDDEITQKQLIVPYQIRVQKTIRQNFYLHPWKANYFALSRTPEQQYVNCLKFLAKSTKHQKFAPYFNRIQQRIQFMRNQFTMFLYHKFRCSYNDLKINCARLLSMYYFITQKAYNLQITGCMRKPPVNKQKNITIAVANQKRFINDYHISKYPNINKTAFNTGLYKYHKKFTKYISDKFTKQFNQLLLPKMDKLFGMWTKLALNGKQLVNQDTMDDIVRIIKIIKQSAYPTELKEQFYLRLICWREGKLNNDILLGYLPFFTMYMRPPLALQKYLIAEVLDKPSITLGDLPLSFVSDVTKTSDISIQQQQRSYVDRDWMGSNRLLIQLMKNNGKVQIPIQFLNQKTKTQKISQSCTVRQLVQILMNSQKQIQDISHFWLYMGYGRQLQLTVLQEDQHIGQIKCQKQDKPKYFVFKRRIYCPEWKYIYQKYSEVVLDSLYYDIKSQFLQGIFFINQTELLDIVSSIFVLDTVEKLKKKQDFKIVIDGRIKDLGNLYPSYIPQHAIQKMLTLSKTELISQLKQKIIQKVMKKQHLKPMQVKKSILRKLQQTPQFFTSNYTFLDKSKKILRISINWYQIIVNAQLQTQKIGLQKIVSIIPQTKYLSITYHKQSSSLGHVNLYGDQNKIISTAHDLLTYCLIRIKMLSSSLYNAYAYETDIKKSGKKKQSNIIRKKLSSAIPTILQQSIIPYFNENKYIKKRRQRKLYANQSLQKLQTKDEQFQLSDNDILTIEKNLQHKIIYPNAYKDIDNKKIKQIQQVQQSSQQNYQVNNNHINQSQFEIPNQLAQAQYRKIAPNFKQDLLIANQPIQQYLFNQSNIMPEIQTATIPIHSIPNYNNLSNNQDNNIPELVPIPDDQPSQKQEKPKLSPTSQKIKTRPKQNR